MKQIMIWMDKLRSLTPLAMSREGRFYVVYPDGKQSQLFDYSAAWNYREIFGGTIIHKPTGQTVT